MNARTDTELYPAVQQIIRTISTKQSVNNKLLEIDDYQIKEVATFVKKVMSLLLCPPVGLKSIPEINNGNDNGNHNSSNKNRWVLGPKQDSIPLLNNYFNIENEINDRDKEKENERIRENLISLSSSSYDGTFL